MDEHSVNIRLTVGRDFSECDYTYDTKFSHSK